MPLFILPADAETFSASLSTRALGKNIEFHSQTHSTNDLALAAARAGAAHGKVFIADLQTGGRGRRGRSWESPPGQSLLFSVLVRPSGIQNTDAGWLPLLSGLACAEALAATCQISPAIKWPNDIVIPMAQAPGWRKLGGILCESVWAASAEQSFVVIGIGLNILQRSEDLPELAKAPPTSVLLETGQEAGRREILRAVLINLEQRINQLSNAATRAALKKDIEDAQRRWWQPDVRLVVQSPEAEEEIAGAFSGLDEFGRLMLSSPDGKAWTLADAEVISAMAKS
ncbi:MAG TPA: biotin--[acetyl-CoA-carboxylase] ligase [Planctomycetota bacterium]|nr:biotin--[acetyl-CoA-carboxylase] ligase [Planctomycetota bacterium]